MKDERFAVLEGEQARLDEMVAEGRFEDRLELINNALTIMSWVLQKAKYGYAIAAVRDPGDNCVVLSMPFLTGLSEE